MSSLSMETGPTATQAMIDVFEELAFLVAECQPSEAERQPHAEQLWAAIPVQGANFSRLTLRAPKLLVYRLAAAVFGMDLISVSDEQALDALAETANTVCGALVRAIGTDGDYSLGLPQTGQGEPPAYSPVLAIETLSVDGEPVALRLEAW